MWFLNFLDVIFSHDHAAFDGLTCVLMCNFSVQQYEMQLHKFSTYNATPIIACEKHIITWNVCKVLHKALHIHFVQEKGMSARWSVVCLQEPPSSKSPNHHSVSQQLFGLFEAAITVFGSQPFLSVHVHFTRRLYDRALLFF